MYSSGRSGSSFGRTGGGGGGGPSEYYDTDQGGNATLAHRVSTSPIKYSILRSTVERFPEKVHCAPQADYNTDTLHKTTVSTAIDKSRMKYAAVFNNTSRFPKPMVTEAPDVTYNTDYLKNADLATLVSRTSVRYSNVRSKAPRLQKGSVTAAPDKVYNVDTGRFMTLSNSVEASPVSYAVMRSNSPRFRRVKMTATGDNLGPGSYDLPDTSVRKKDQTARQLSSFKSASPRFHGRHDPSKFLGSTWHQGRDTREWSKKSFKISNTKINRPVYLPSTMPKMAMVLMTERAAGEALQPSQWQGSRRSGSGTKRRAVRRRRRAPRGCESSSWHTQVTIGVIGVVVVDGGQSNLGLARRGRGGYSSAF